jgi:hypothetical protein
MQARKRQCLRHRFGVLELVLGHHPDDETLLEQRIAIVERQFRKERKHGLADVLYVSACGLRWQERQPAALAACVRERVIKVVVVRRECAQSADPSQEPQLLEVADVREIPDERRLQWRDLKCQLFVRERLQQILSPLSRVLQGYDELRR